MAGDVALTPIELSTAAQFRLGSAVVNPAAHEAIFNGSAERIQPQNLKVLIALAEKRGAVVTCDELIARCWDGRAIGDDVIHRAISTLRQLATKIGGFTIETVPKAGYRLTEEKRRRFPPWVGTAAFVFLSVGALVAFQKRQAAGVPARAPTVAEEKEAIRTLDLKAVERLLEAGWKPNAALDTDRNTALETLVGNCEWDTGHDRHQMVLVARTLIEAGARLDARNVWGDTPYSIAKAGRYCGPDHPVTKMFKMYCAQGRTPLRDGCMASYELKRGEHFAKD